MRMRAAVVAALTGLALAVPVAPATAAACAQGAGVTVLVEFGSLGGGTQTRCSAGDPSSGLGALRGAGFTPTRAAQEPGYFLCRIDGKPANDPCQRTSPADAYWSYWHAKAGGSWTYGDVGPADYDPAPGAVEGWAFGAGKPPSSPPPPAAAPSRRSPRPTAAASAPPPSPRASSPARASGSATQAATAPSALAATAPATVAASDGPSSSPAADGALDDASGDDAAGSNPVVSIGLNDTGSTRDLAVGGGVLVLLLGATALSAVRRRRGRS